MQSKFKKYTEANRAAWNEVTPKHQRAAKVKWDKVFMQPGFVVMRAEDVDLLKKMGIEGKSVAHLCCNNGIELLVNGVLGFYIGFGRSQNVSVFAEIAIGIGDNIYIGAVMTKSERRIRDLGVFIAVVDNDSHLFPLKVLVILAGFRRLFPSLKPANHSVKKRTVVAGISTSYSPEEMVGKQVIIVANLKPAKLMGVESRGMLIAAVDKKGATVATLDKPVSPGTPLR